MRCHGAGRSLRLMPRLRDGRESGLRRARGHTHYILNKFAGGGWVSKFRPAVRGEVRTASWIAGGRRLARGGRVDDKLQKRTLMTEA